MLVTAPPDVFSALSRRAEVAAILPEQTLEGPAPLAATASPAAEPNIDLVSAPAVWNLGPNGEGIVVASMDTGVDGSHPDLAPRFRGGGNSWYDPYRQHPSIPVDLNGHGTGVTAIMVGGSAGSGAIGVAPASKWIAVKIFNDRNQATTSAIHRGYQWLLDPDGNPATADAPNVVNSSWTYGGPGCNLEFEPDLAALQAAGIVPVFAAGNFGPGDAPAPARATTRAAFPVGAIDNAGAPDADSSRGPVSCGGDRTFPELVAPGVQVRTAALFGQYTQASGTSLAAPHVAGTLRAVAQRVPRPLRSRTARCADERRGRSRPPRRRQHLRRGAPRHALAAYLGVRGGVPLLVDDFASGDLSQWTAAVTGNGAARGAPRCRTRRWLRFAGAHRWRHGQLSLGRLARCRNAVQCRASTSPQTVWRCHAGCRSVFSPLMTGPGTTCSPSKSRRCRGATRCGLWPAIQAVGLATRWPRWAIRRARARGRLGSVQRARCAGRPAGLLRRRRTGGCGRRSGHRRLRGGRGPARAVVGRLFVGVGRGALRRFRLQPRRGDWPLGWPTLLARSRPADHLRPCCRSSLQAEVIELSARRMNGG